MIDIKLIRKDLETTEKKLQTKDPSIRLDSLLSLDEQIREIKNQVELLKAEKNKIAKDVGLAKAKGQDFLPLMEKSQTLSDQIQSLDEQLKVLEPKWIHEMALLPNIPDDDVKVSPDKDNVCIKEWGTLPNFSFPFKNHVELNDSLELFDFKRGAKVTGSGWSIYRGDGARLEWALINYMIDTHIKNGFEFFMPPHVVRKEMMFGSGQLPKFSTQLFKLDDQDYPHYLIPTAEVVLNGLHYDEILEESDLPKLYCSYTPCFRREAGAAGSQERGLIRMHQFNKVEMFAFTKPQDSKAVFDNLLKSAENILQGLGLHYKNMLLTTGDMSFASARTVDVEVWLPGQNRYYEVSSVSNCTDFQARRSQTRYRDKSTGKVELVHTLNGSGLATSRLMVAILENNQQEDGSVIIPEVLRPYLGGLTHLKPNKK